MLDSSTCCLKNSMIILPQTCGVVKYFLRSFFEILKAAPKAGKQTERLYFKSDQTPYFRVFRRMPGPMVVAMVALLK